MDDLLRKSCHKILASINSDQPNEKNVNKMIPQKKLRNNHDIKDTSNYYLKHDAYFENVRTGSP